MPGDGRSEWTRGEVETDVRGELPSVGLKLVLTEREADWIRSSKATTGQQSR